MFISSLCLQYLTINMIASHFMCNAIASLRTCGRYLISCKRLMQGSTSLVQSVNVLPINTEVQDLITGGNKDNCVCTFMLSGYT